MSDLLDITFARAGALWLLLILPMMAFVAWKYTPRRDNRKRGLAALRALRWMESRVVRVRHSIAATNRARTSRAQARRPDDRSVHVPARMSVPGGMNGPRAAPMGAGRAAQTNPPPRSRTSPARRSASPSCWHAQAWVRAAISNG